MDDLVSRVYTRELLETLSDTEVQLSERALIRHISVLRSNSKRTRLFEVELCYVQDEISRRRASALGHSQYLTRQQALETAPVQ